MMDTITIETNITYGMVIFCGVVRSNPFKEYREAKFREIREELVALGYTVLSETLEPECEWDRLIVRAERKTQPSLWDERVELAAEKKL